MAILQNKHLVLKLSALMVLLSQIGGHSTIRASSPSEAENFFQHIINNLTTYEFESDSEFRPSDIIFVLDRPNYSSALQTGFEFLLGLIQSFLENFNVDRDSSRVSLVISSKSSCDVPINDVPKGELSKCGVVYYLRRLKLKATTIPRGNECSDPLTSALNIAKSGRPGVPKVVIVMAYDSTPGLERTLNETVETMNMFSFEGWDISKRGPQIQVYGVGVGKANMTDLSRVTAHVTNRLVHINTVRDLAALGRWLETSVDLTHNGKSEETINLWTREAVETNFACRMTCSKHAQCYCSLRTGQTLCTCLPGFYGNGMQCTACPRGTYKEDSSAQRHCIPCPAHTGTRARGTTSFKMCKPGFGRDIQQALKKCPELPVVAHASKFGVDYLISTAVRNTGQHCSNMAGTSCHFQCHRNFRLIGYPGLMCEWEGLWLGILPRCVRTSDSDCGTLFELGQQDLHGKTTYFNSSSSSSSNTNGNTNRPPVFAPTFPRHYDNRNNPDERFDLQHMAGYPFADLDYEYSHYENRFRGGRNTSTHQGAIVRVTCPPGWMTIGDPERSCLPHGVWSLTPAHCVDMQCPPIPRTEGLRIFPRTCAQNRQAVGTECSLTCQSGFRLVGSGNVTCNNRRWTSNVLNIANKPEDVFGICIDTEPPHITCHRNLTLHVSRRYIRLLYWEDVQPIVSDNSGHVTVTSPDLPGSPFPVYLGHSTIRFMAKDKYHSSTCTMGIKVIDPNVQAVMCPTTEVEIHRVHAISPLVLPNVVRFARMDSRGREAESVNHLCNPANESLVGLGRHSVSCWAYIDQGPLGAQCNFSVNIKLTCHLWPSPLHGNRSCSPTSTSQFTCTVSCNPGFEFHEMPRDQYVCGLDGHWQNNMDRWPDCSNSYTRVGVVRDTSYSLRDLYPNSSFCEAHRLSLRLRVLTRVSRVLRTRCSDPGICSIVKLNVTCFQYDEADPYYYDSNEPPRVPSYEPTLNYTLKVDSASHSMDYNLGVLENVSLELRDILRNFLNLSQESGLLGEPRGVDCRPGYQHLADVLCIACPPGTYWNQQEKRCYRCALGEYQPQEGQLSCIKCPLDTWTEAHGAYNRSECADLCPAGHWSHNGLTPCKPCLRGQYQPRESAAICLSCARGMTTESEGTVMAHDCQKECGRGFYSWNGKEPGCEPCALDTFQPMEGQTMCEPLGPMPSTGALTCEDTSLLCYNGGWCSDTADVRGIPICQCQRGYEGFICQDLDVHFCPWHYICPNSSLTDENQSKFWQYNDSCLSAVCLNGGTCVNSNSSNSYECFCPLEYSGLHCETPVLLCRRIPCLHGACEDGMCLCDSQDKDCEPPEDPCRYHSCSFGSTCLKRRAGGYICKCQPGRTGPHCGDELSSDFDMVFGLEPRLGWDVTLPEEFMPSLTAMTVCMWLRPSPMTSFFTLVTFSANASAETPFVDPYTGSYTVFKLKQSEQLYIQFFVETVKTEVIIPSLVWTHLCFTWKQFSGNWQLFLNGTLSANGSLAVTDEQVLPQNTLVTIAPRNTTLSDWMIFQGRVSQFSIFSQVLTTAQIRGLANPVACNGSYYGDVISWNNVLPYALDKRRSLCLDVNECWFPSQFPCPPPTDVCLDQLGSYSCVRPQRHRDSNTGAGIRVWLERVGVATIVAVVVLVLLFIFVRCMRKRNIRSSTGQNSSVQLRQHVDFHGQANPGASSGGDSSGTNSNRISRANSGSHRSIVRSSGRKVDGPSIFRRTSTPEDTRRLLAVTDALEETVIFDQNDSTASRRTTSFSDERPQTEQFDGNSHKAESQQQNFIINANYTSAGTEQILYLTEKGAVHVSPSGEEPTPLTFRTAARGTANPIEFLRQKFPTLAFGRSNRIVQPSAYKSLKQVNAASMDYEDDDSKDHAMEDPYLVSPDDEIRELQADDANTDNFPGSSRPVSSSNAGN